MLKSQGLLSSFYDTIVFKSEDSLNSRTAANFEFKLLIRPLLSIAFRKSISTSSSAEPDILNDLHTGDEGNFKNCNEKYGVL